MIIFIQLTNKTLSAKLEGARFIDTTTDATSVMANTVLFNWIQWPWPFLSAGGQRVCLVHPFSLYFLESACLIHLLVYILSVY